MTLGGPLSFTRLLPFLRKALAVAWVVGAAIGAISEGASPWIAGPLLLLMVGYLLRPQQFRPILVSTLVLFLSGVVIFVHVYFRTILMVPVIAFTGLGIAGIVLSFYGRGPVAFVLGFALSLISSLQYPENPVFTSPRSQAECDARVGELEQHLSSFIEHSFLSPGEQRLPVKPAWAPIRRRPYLLEVGSGGKWFGSPLPGDRAAAATELTQRLVPLFNRGRPPDIFLAVDIDQSVDEVTLLLRDLPPVNIWVLAIKGPGPLGPPPPGAEGFASALDASHEERARILALELSRRLGPCPAAAKQAALIKKAPPEDAKRFMVEEISRGLEECQCSYIDLDALEYLMKIFLDVPAHEYSARWIPRDSEGVLMMPDESGLSFGEWAALL